MASYQYEQLNDESFQQLSQSLLVKEFQGIQCFPVGQPDGGRDAIARFYGGTPEAAGFILFQVKFARRDLNPSEARDWLLRTLRNELPKVRNQIKEGAKEFVLVTNVAGTAHPEVGSIDKLHDLLVEHIPIPVQAWWRDDLDRRLDNEWDLKFMYPALFSGADLLRLVVEASPSESRERRQNAITAFLSGQFESDREVKFKQVELQNDIFELFTDVPILPRSPAGKRQIAVERLVVAFHSAATSESGEVDWLRVREWLEIASGGDRSFGNYYPRDETWLNSASLLLNSAFQEANPLVILEGAPGQGKSTIAQYICQVHRMRFLESEGNSAIDPAHLSARLRLPFKVELRDFATWLSGGNPFGSVTNGDSREGAPRSLESFLSALVRYASGGSHFDVSDFHSTIKSTPVLVILDGLDEVAEVRQRQRMVEEISSAVARLNGLAASLQVVVTSRPTPFMNSTVLPSDTFATYSLGSLTRPLITEYAERWLKSRDIDDAVARDIRHILDSKLAEPHLRDLARNPMQLAILLSLIHRRGISLPDKRTALYDSYMEIFFDRESEKADVVKENRELLIRIHRYLAWILQAGAEVDSGSNSGTHRAGSSLSGSISEEDLRILLREFLEKDRSDPDLIQELFSGMVERVVAIVSRVQGTFEFDVQTLREYFAARYLYETAPYSPAGEEHRGTRSDRWRALSRNFYWLNVARFYAGCYSEGELASLVYALTDLSKDDFFRSTSHPQLLTATLLGDWVFSQSPRAMEDVVDLLLEPRGLRMLVAGTSSEYSHAEDVIVRDRRGRRRLVSACKELLKSNRPSEQLNEVIRKVLRPNAEPVELLDWWTDELRSADITQASKWCAIGETLQCWSIVNLDTVIDLLGREEIPSTSVIAELLHANRMDVLEGEERLFEQAVEAVLAGERIGWPRGGSLLQRLAGCVEWMTQSSRRQWYSISMWQSQMEYWNELQGNEEDHDWPDYPAAERCARVVSAFKDAIGRPSEEWETSIEPWHLVIQQGISEFGTCTKFVELANIAAGIQSREEKCDDNSDLFDVHQPIVRRARHARLRAGSQKWWLRHLRSATNSDDIWMALLFFSTWAGSRTIEEIVEEFDRLVARLETSEWQSLHSSLCTAVEFNSRRSWIRRLVINVSELPLSLNLRTVALLAERSTPRIVGELYERYLTNYNGADPILLSLRTDVQVSQALEDETKWTQAIESLRSSYELGAPNSRTLSQHLRFDATLPDELAIEVVNQPLEFPAALVRVAEAQCRQLNVSEIVPVGNVAADEGWLAG